MFALLHPAIGMPGRRPRAIVTPPAALLPVLLLALAVVTTTVPAAAPDPAPSVPAPASAAAPAPPARATLSARIDSLFAAAYAPDEPGAAVLVQHGDEALLRKGYGMADLELGTPVAPEMVFHLCSITKQFTAVAVLMLASEGRLDLDAPLGRYLPDYPQPGASATIHQLLTHTSGIPSYTDDPAFWETACVDRGLDELIAAWRDRPPDFPPGTDWRYSNSGYVLLGKVIEVVSGTGYARFIEERLCAPLGLQATTYGDAARIVPGRVRGYEYAEGSWRNAACVSLNLAHAAGALLSNVDDLVAWTAALLHGDRLLSAPWRARLLTPGTLADGRETFYACGLEIHTLAGHRLVAHGGGGGGFATYAAHVPDLDLTVIVLANRGEGRPAPQMLAERAIALCLDLPAGGRPSLSQAIEIRDEALLDALAGRYELAPGFVVTVRREGVTLLVQPTGQPALRIHPLSAALWFPVEIDALIEFQGFADGRADALVLTQNGRELPARRVECAAPRGRSADPRPDRARSSRSAAPRRTTPAS